MDEAGTAVCLVAVGDVRPLGQGELETTRSGQLRVGAAVGFDGDRPFELAGRVHLRLGDDLALGSLARCRLGLSVGSWSPPQAAVVLEASASPLVLWLQQRPS